MDFLSLLFRGLGFIWKITVPASDREEIFLLLLENIANPLSWSILANLSASQVTRRIRKYVLNRDPKEAWRLKESYKDTFALEAVSAAIIAQIAITMPNISDFGNIHWAATAFAYTSLASGLLSTFFAFYVQRTLGDLHSEEDVYEWLTSPVNNIARRFSRSFFGRIISRWIGQQTANEGDRVPSITAAAILIAPSRLLAASIISLFVALGIYLGSAYTAKLGTLQGSHANLAVLLFFMIVSAWAILEIYLPLNSKRVDQFAASLVRNVEDRDIQHPESGNSNNKVPPAIAVASNETSETGQIIREALKASIRAQEDSLKAQNALLELIDSRSPLWIKHE